MANAFLNIFTNNPTAGGTDGTMVSENDFTSPISVTLDASKDEEKVIKLAIRTESGYVTQSDTTISDSGDTNDRLKLSFSSDTGWADSITFSDTIVASNVIFYAKASSNSAEKPQSDRSIKLNVQAVIQAVGS